MSKKVLPEIGEFGWGQKLNEYILDVVGDVNSVSEDYNSLNGRVGGLEQDYGTLNGTVGGIVSDVSLLNKSVINILMYGAVGDGIEDDTIAVQSAIDAAFSKPIAANQTLGLNYYGTVIDFGGKTVKISETLYLPKGSGIVFTNGNLIAADDFAGKFMISTYEAGKQEDWGYPKHNSQIKFSNMTMNCRNVCSGIELLGVSDVWVDSCVIHHFTEYGIYAYGSGDDHALYIDKSHIYQYEWNEWTGGSIPTAMGIYMGVYDSLITNSYVYLCKTGIYCSRRSQRILGNHIWGCNKLLVLGYLRAAKEWQTATDYAADDVVIAGDYQEYFCKEPHTSDDFATDLSADKWKALVQDVCIYNYIISGNWFDTQDYAECSIKIIGSDKGSDIGAEGIIITENTFAGRTSNSTIDTFGYILISGFDNVAQLTIKNSIIKNNFFNSEKDTDKGLIVDELYVKYKPSTGNVFTDNTFAGVVKPFSTEVVFTDYKDISGMGITIIEADVPNELIVLGDVVDLRASYLSLDGAKSTATISNNEVSLKEIIENNLVLNISDNTTLLYTNGDLPDGDYSFYARTSINDSRTIYYPNGQNNSVDDGRYNLFKFTISSGDFTNPSRVQIGHGFAQIHGIRHEGAAGEYKVDYSLYVPSGGSPVSNTKIRIKYG